MAGRGVIYHVPEQKKKQPKYDKGKESYPLYLRYNFVKITLLKRDNYVLTLRKRLFCAVKPTFLPCKRAAFGMQNNRFWNALTMR